MASLNFTSSLLLVDQLAKSSKGIRWRVLGGTFSRWIAQLPLTCMWHFYLEVVVVVHAWKTCCVSHFGVGVVPTLQTIAIVARSQDNVTCLAAMRKYRLN